MSKNFENLNTSDNINDFKALLVNALDYENNQFFVTDLNNKIYDEKNNNNNNKLNEKGEKEIKEIKEEENNKENINNIKTES